MAIVSIVFQPYWWNPLFVNTGLASSTPINPRARNWLNIHRDNNIICDTAGGKTGFTITGQNNPFSIRVKIIFSTFSFVFLLRLNPDDQTTLSLNDQTKNIYFQLDGAWHFFYFLPVYQKQLIHILRTYYWFRTVIRLNAKLRILYA